MKLVQHAAPEHKASKQIVKVKERAIPWKDVKLRQQQLEAVEAARKHKAEREIVLEAAVSAVAHVAPEHKANREVVLEVAPQKGNGRPPD